MTREWHDFLIYTCRLNSQYPSAYLLIFTRRLNSQYPSFLRFTTFCSAHRSPIILESSLFEISDVLFCAQESQNSWKFIFWDFWRFVLRTEVPYIMIAFLETSDFLFCAQESQNSWKCISWDFRRFVLRTIICESVCFEIDGVIFLNNSQNSGEKFCPRQRSCSRQVISSKTSRILEQICPMQRSCTGRVISSNKIGILENVLPQAMQQPQTSDFFKKKLDF